MSGNSIEILLLDVINRTGPFFQTIGVLSVRRSSPISLYLRVRARAMDKRKPSACEVARKALVKKSTEELTSG